ncbi:uncharacterized protein [Cicer arietinum]|uniref:uncharacterized protein n=1 Tax=Cicer arietinum TaxID=3827 RepID=UPI00032A6DF4
MEPQRVSGDETTDGNLVFTFRWNAIRRVYEMYQHRRDDNQSQISEEWDLRIYSHDGNYIFRENNNNNNNQSKLFGRENITRIKIEEGAPYFEKDLICSICLDELPVGSEVIQLPVPCCHVYHEECIMRWLDMSNICPLCRRPVS